MKAPEQSHFIQRFKFDFEIESKDDAHKLHTDLSRIFNARIKFMLEEIMNELDDAGHVIRIPQLVIDLGEIYEGSLEKEVLMRFESAFRRELSLRIGELRHGRAAISAEKGERIPVVPARMEIVAFFLVNGRLPAGAEQMAGKLEPLILDLIEGNPANVVRMLRAVARKQGALKRLSVVFSEKVVSKIYSAVLSENAISISAIEKKLVADAAKIIQRPQAILVMEVRQAIFRYLLIDPPTIFDRRKFQTAVALDIKTTFGVEDAKGFGDVTAQQEAFSSQNEKRERRKAALDVVERYLKGSTTSDMPIALAEAWEYLVQQEASALRKFLASKRISTASIATLVQALSPAAMRDFVQKIVPSSPMQLIHVAASITSAFAAQRKGASAEKKFAAEVYAVLIQQLALNPSVTPSATKIAEAIQAHLSKLPDAPKQLLKNWEKLDLPGVTTAATRKRQQAEQTAKDSEAQKEFDAQVAALKARTKQGQGAELDTENVETNDESAKDPDSKKKGKKSSKAAADNAAQEGKDLEMFEDDEAFFKRYRAQLSERSAGIEFEELPSSEDADLLPSLSTAEGRIEMFLQILVNGSRPWWAEAVSPVQLEIYVKSAIANHPQVVKAAFARLVRTLPTARYPEIVNKLLTSVNETTINNLLMALAPEIGGFVTTISMALGNWWEQEKDNLTLPPHLAARYQFVWHAAVKYVLAYMTSGYSPGQMLRYVMKELSTATGLSSRATIEQLNVIAETALAKGEKRFNALKAMIPKTFEGLQITPAAPHEPADAAWLTMEALAQVAANRGIVQEEEVPEKQPQPEDNLTPQERFMLDRLKQAQQKAKEQAITEGEPETVQDVDNQKVVEQRDGEELELPEQPEEKTPEFESEAARIEQERKIAAQEKAAAEAAIAAESERLQREKERFEQEKQRLPRSKTKLTPEEEAAEESMVLEVIREYLEHGSLNATVTNYFTPSTFKALLLGTLGLSSKPLVQTLRASMTKSAARLRVIALGDEVALRVVGLLQSLVSSKMLPFVEEVLRLFSTSSAPVSRIHVLDHAMRYALQTAGGTFVPLHYVRDFVEYVAGLPGRDVRDVLLWANKRMESSSSPLKEAMVEMLDVVDRIVQSQGQSKPKQVSTPSAPVIIKAPDGDIYITNAGAGIVHIIFGQLFQAFHLLTDDKLAFVSREAASRAAHYIQYLTDKELDAPEEKMVFNKLLVGLPLEQPLEPLTEPINQDEIDTCEYVMQTLCEKWSVMKSAGPDYMRKTFLMREGRLRANGDGWIIRVEQTGIDILKNKIPWATNPIRLPWLTYLIDVDWP